MLSLLLFLSLISNRLTAAFFGTPAYIESLYGLLNASLTSPALLLAVAITLAASALI